MMDESKLFLVCGTLVLMTIVGSVAYYNIQHQAVLSKNIENGIAKGVDPVAVRCAYAQERDIICVAYAATKAQEAPTVRK
jgi:hypothetical protein